MIKNSVGRTSSVKEKKNSGDSTRDLIGFPDRLISIINKKNTPLRMERIMM